MDVGEIIKDYQVIERIGRGGMADVWSARDGKLNRMVAVKTIAHGLSPDADPVGMFKREAETIDQRFWAEVRALPRQQMAVTVLHYVEDQSVEAIAALLGCSTGTVKTQLFRARRTLAARLGAQREEGHDA